MAMKNLFVYLTIILSIQGSLWSKNAARSEQSMPIIGQKFVRITHSTSGHTAHILGSCHIVDLNAAISTLPVSARETILNARYLVGESFTNESSVYKKRKKVQKWWKKLEKNHQAKRFLQATRTKPSIKYYPESIALTILATSEYRCEKECLRAFSKTAIVGEMDNQILHHAIQNHSQLFSLDDARSDNFGLKEYKNFLGNQKLIEITLNQLNISSQTAKIAKLVHKDNQFKALRSRTAKKSIKLEKKIQANANRLKMKEQELCRLQGQSPRYRHKIRTTLKKQARCLERSLRFSYLHPSRTALCSSSNRLTVRDLYWHPKIINHIQTGRTPLFVFGAAHLGNCVQRLQMDGYRVDGLDSDGQWFELALVN